ncbi:MAG: hypothetical protein KDE53_10075, partial [Caldilineaceae bacterium]|nr:hypothetical protein [Caldilineaceae bacterium]
MTIEPQTVSPEMHRNRYIIGIDLGTTNSALSYVDLAEQSATSSDTPPTIHIFDVPQLTAP